jgi:tRNA-dihydrouridine synthase
MIVVHGRTRCQFYEGRADWEAIASVKKAVSVPVVANGDLTAADHQGEMLRASGADAVMIGRGACGRPWFPGRIGRSSAADGLERIVFADLVTEHYEAMIEHYGPRVGPRHARKHLGWYLDGFQAATGAAPTADRASVMTGTDPAAVAALLRRLFGALTVADVDRPASLLDQAA